MVLDCLDNLQAELEDQVVDLHLRQLDLSSFRSVREFCDQLIRKEVRLDVLINCPGAKGDRRKMITMEGMEASMAANYFGPFLLTNLLLGKRILNLGGLSLSVARC